MKNNKLLLHYIIGIAALIVLLAALYFIYDDPQRTKSLMITTIACALVAVGQFLIIKQKKKSMKK